MDGEVILQEGFRPLSLVVAELFCGCEVLQIVVVGVNLNAVWESLKVGPPLMEGFDDHEEFLVVDVIVELHRDHQMGVEGDGAEILPSGVRLGEYSGHGVVGGIAFEYNWQGGVKMAEDQDGGEGLLEEEEYTLALAVPIPRGVLSHESVERFGDSRVVVDESAIKVSEPQE
ncbi:hypothetical protein C0989_010601 [Termitomyces sp. Mn162]|nr:hypothetical protein C0989_010601 [Termitomyces sp. Mn162]